MALCEYDSLLVTASRRMWVIGYIILQVLCSKHTKMKLDMLHMAISDQFWLKAAQYTMFCVCTLRYNASLPQFTSFSGRFDIIQRQILLESQNFWTHRSALMRSSLCTMVYYRWHHYPAKASQKTSNMQK